MKKHFKILLFMITILVIILIDFSITLEINSILNSSNILTLGVLIITVVSLLYISALVITRLYYYLKLNDYIDFE